MTEITTLVVVYILGLLFAAIFLNLWSSETGPKALLGLGWTAIFLIALFYAEKKK